MHAETANRTRSKEKCCLPIKVTPLLRRVIFNGQNSVQLSTKHRVYSNMNYSVNDRFPPDSVSRLNYPPGNTHLVLGRRDGTPGYGTKFVKFLKQFLVRFSHGLKQILLMECLQRTYYAHFLFHICTLLDHTEPWCSLSVHPGSQMSHLHPPPPKKKIPSFKPNLLSFSVSSNSGGWVELSQSCVPEVAVLNAPPLIHIIPTK